MLIGIDMLIASILALYKNLPTYMVVRDDLLICVVILNNVDWYRYVIAVLPVPFCYVFLICGFVAHIFTLV